MTAKPQKAIDAAAEWRSGLTATIGAVLLFETLTGLAIWLLPFSEFNQFGVVLHTVVGVVGLAFILWFVARHWWVRRRGNLSHYQLLGYISVSFLAVCLVSGVWLTWQGLVGPRIGYGWSAVHLYTGIGLTLFVIIHLGVMVVRPSSVTQERRLLAKARWRFFSISLVGSGVLVLLTGLWAWVYQEPATMRAFPADYNWQFGADRPFAPSMARLDDAKWRNAMQQRVLEVLEDTDGQAYQATLKTPSLEPQGWITRTQTALAGLELAPEQRSRIGEILAGAERTLHNSGAVNSRVLAGSKGCGSSSCHSEIYKEWLPSAHRYSSLDDMFQRVQTLLAEEAAPKYTRYCAGCHDPISLFSGAKNAGNVTLSADGANEGASCVVCHSIVQADVQGNGDYTVRPPRRYAYELIEGPAAKFVSDFVIRTYPGQHRRSFTRRLYKTPEYCGSCHKQYVDKELNTDIGKVQGQNQYDSWKNSRWNIDKSPDKNITCRECHMPLVTSSDPARGDQTDYNRTPDDGKHRSHRTLASNQYIPILQKLEGGEEHVRLVEKWLRGEIEIPEIADKWTTGPVVRMEILAPEAVNPGQEVQLQVLLTNNKAGHDFPTGPLDMIESWVELKVTDASGTMLYHTGQLGEDGRVRDTLLSFRADGFDRQGRLIDRHNLWDLVGASYKRAMYPGQTDSIETKFQCPALARGPVVAGDGKTVPGRRTDQFSFAAPTATGPGEMTVEAILWYRKANAAFLDRVYGLEKIVRAPVTAVTRTVAKIKLLGEHRRDDAGDVDGPS